MFGGGTIEAFTPAGNFGGLFFSLANVPLTVGGIWGLGFGNGVIGGSGPKTSLSFTAGTFNQAHGVFGSMIPKSGLGHKPLVAYEQQLLYLSFSANYPFHSLTPVYEEAKRRASEDGSFIFFGGVFDATPEPLYLDWVHLNPSGK